MNTDLKRNVFYKTYVNLHHIHSVISLSCHESEIFDPKPNTHRLVVIKRFTCGEVSVQTVTQACI